MLIALHRLPDFSVIIRAMGGNGEADQRAALNELHRRGLWLGDDGDELGGQAGAAIRAAGRPVPATKEERRAVLAELGYCRAPVPVEARPALPVIFRAERSGDFKGHVTAVFPTMPGTGPYDVTCYAHVGQHGTASREWYWSTRAAKPEEFADLLAELRSIYERDDDPDAVHLVVAQRWTKHHDAARRYELRR